MDSTISTYTKVPSVRGFMKPVLRALVYLGDSGTNDEIDEKALELMGLPLALADLPHVRYKGTPREIDTGRTEAEYRLAWARTYLKAAGLIENSSQSVWSLTELGRSSNFSEAEIVARARAAMANPAEGSELEEDSSIPLHSIEEEPKWEDQLLEAVRSMAPEAFERLSQRLLREAGFIEVTVTGKSGDGGIDGRGLIRLNKLVTLHAVFQCKKYQGDIGPETIREFRGAMAGRSDLGIFLTTGRFTKGARSEASRDGVPPIDLIDAVRLTELLRELRLGVEEQLVPKITINAEFFKNF